MGCGAALLAIYDKIPQKNPLPKERSGSLLHLLLDLPSSPATVSLFQELKPEALRPNLSEGLPFSKRIYCFSSLLIGMLIKNFRFFYLSMLRLMKGQIYMLITTYYAYLT